MSITFGISELQDGEPTASRICVSWLGVGVGGRRGGGEGRIKEEPRLGWGGGEGWGRWGGWGEWGGKETISQRNRG